MGSRFVVVLTHQATLLRKLREPTGLQIARKGLLHKAPAEAALRAANIRCSAPHNIGIKTLSKKT